jgi:hypothetical protein
MDFSTRPRNPNSSAACSGSISDTDPSSAFLVTVFPAAPIWISIDLSLAS